MTQDADILHPKVVHEDPGADTNAIAVLSTLEGFDFEVEISCWNKDFADGDVLAANAYQVLFGIIANPSTRTGFSMRHGYLLHVEEDEWPQLVKIDSLKLEETDVLGPKLGVIVGDCQRDTSAVLPDGLRWRINDYERIKMVYKSCPEPRLFFGIGGYAPVAVDFGGEITRDCYRPCIMSVGYSEVRFQVLEVKALKTKRAFGRLTDNSYANLWKNMRFTDAEIRCEGRSLKAHRAVLSAKSKTFARLFEGSGTEAATSVVDMSGEDLGAVQALIEHIYTDYLSESADAALLLPLADRYEVFACVDDCASALEKEALEHPAKVLRTLRPYCNDERLGRVWLRTCNVIMADKDLTMAVFENP